MQKQGSFALFAIALVVVAAIMSLEFGDWFIWLPVLLGLASVAGVRKAMSRGRRRCR